MILHSAQKKRAVIVQEQLGVYLENGQVNAML